MGGVYSLTIHLCESGHFLFDDFHIGMFASREQAECVGKHYCSHVCGFRDYPCELLITEVPIVDYPCETQTVYRFCAWDEDEYGDAINVIESDCYLLREKAVEDMNAARLANSRAEWRLNSYYLGECEWKEGFVRCE